MIGIAMLDEILKLLEGKSLVEVATAADVPYHWLRRVQLGEVSSPNLARLEKLLVYLRTL